MDTGNQVACNECEQAPSERRAWQTPRVIISQLAETKGGINANTDVDGSQTS